MLLNVNHKNTVSTDGPGKVIWITGFSGAGKTTIGRLVYERLQGIKSNVVFLDGDMLRDIFGNESGYTLEERRELAMSYSRLCRMLSEQGVDVICATISLFKEVHNYNRKNIKNYYEIFIECQMQELIRRDQKGIYSKALNDKIENVVGLNLSYDRPKECDLVINNTTSNALNEKVEQILKFIISKDCLLTKRLPQEFTDEDWDYSLQAEYYKYRPNYCEKAVDMLINYVGAKKEQNYLIADIGAGTGNLSILFLERGLNVIAIEPNDTMRYIGMQQTNKFGNVKWINASGISTGFKDKSIDWVAFGSSFNVIDRISALKESHRILKDGGFFTCIWNHRHLNEPIQKIAEDIIVEFIPDYKRGVRRLDQRLIIEQNYHLFSNIFYLEVDFEVERTIDTYINAWKSVKNKYWDLKTDEGRDLFQRITDKMREKMPSRFTIKYTTRAWTAQKVAGN